MKITIKTKQKYIFPRFTELQNRIREKVHERYEFLDFHCFEKNIVTIQNKVKMAMLAEPKRRQKWSLNPRGSLWSKDENKFGQKLLEKLGWNAGEGLGAESQGMKAPISIHSNSETRGLGHTGGDDDVWLTHKDNFDDVLSSLNSVHNSHANSDDDDSKPQEFTSMAEMSKKAKGRVHYEKFTRGKDLSRYTETDLSCILGTKKAKKRKMDIAADKKALEDEKAEREQRIEGVGKKDESGLMVIQGGSMDDYFQKKMKMKQNKSEGKSAEEEKEESKEVIEPQDEMKPKKKKSSKRDKSRASPDIDESTADVLEPKDGESIKPKKKKSSKKDKSEPIESKEASPPVADDVEESSVGKKKKKSKRKDKCDIVQEKEVEEAVIVVQEIEKKKSKRDKKKQQKSLESETKDQVDLIIEEEKVTSELVVKAATDDGDDQKKSDKKAKKRKLEEDLANQDLPAFKGSSLKKIKGYGNHQSAAAVIPEQSQASPDAFESTDVLESKAVEESVLKSKKKKTSKKDKSDSKEASLVTNEKDDESTEVLESKAVEESVLKSKKKKTSKKDKSDSKEASPESTEVLEAKVDDDQPRKKKSSKKTPEPNELSLGSSFNKWETANLGDDQANEKFRRMMGIKSGGAQDKVTTGTSGAQYSAVTNQNTAKMFADQEEHFERARAITHTKRGKGLGFAKEEKKPLFHGKKTTFEDL
jgi:Pin2-interacting protein X1